MRDLNIICKLVRSVIFGSGESLSGKVDWQRIFELAGQNGVSGICYQAVAALPSGIQPDFDLMLRWDVSVQGLRDWHERRRAATQSLRMLLEEHGIRMLLLKGETLASLYPDPTLRESWDVDFVALDSSAADAFDRCNALVGDMGMTVGSQVKHSSFRYMDVTFENHTLSETAGYNSVHHRTVAMLRDAVSNAIVRPDGCLELDCVTQTVFAMKHLAQHICYSDGRASLRMLLDVAMLLVRHPSVIEVWDKKLSHVGLRRFSAIVTCAVEDLFHLGLRRDWGLFTRFEAGLFVRMFVDDSDRVLRYLAKFLILPLKPGEVLRLWYEKAQALMKIPFSFMSLRSR